jgi:2-polyprenyl-3-methyl-5-hydroxy-6-metoxy-1,4-benzoquinol methylase
MEPTNLGKKYDKIAQWWHDSHTHSDYGVQQLEKALTFCARYEKALDVGCGAGGRLIQILENRGFSITGIDVSAEMVKLAQQNHPKQNFYVQDICTWETEETFDFIIAWDSIFHLPLNAQKSVLAKLCNFLSPQGVLIYTLGNATGEHTTTWHNDEFYYSSIGINENLLSLINHQLLILHLELDQFPEKHAYVIAQKS